MEKVTSKYTIAKAALHSLQAALFHIEHEQQLTIEAITHPEETTNQTKLIARDSLIKRFEYTIDAFIKYVKEYVRVKLGAEYQFSKQLIRALFAAKKIDAQTCELLLDMVDDRNITAHSYLEIIANKIARKIPLYCKTMHHLLEKMNEDEKLWVKK